MLNPGVLVELLLVFQEYLDQEHIDLVKPPLVTNVEREEWVYQSKYGEDGTEESISNKRDTQLLQLLLPQELFHWYWLEDTESVKSHKSHLLLKTKLNHMKRLLMLSISWRDSVLLKMFKKLFPQKLLELVSVNKEERNTELERVHLLSISMRMLNCWKLLEVIILINNFIRCSRCWSRQRY